MILIAFGANLPGPAGPPRQTVDAVLKSLATGPVRLMSRSRFYRSAPVPPADQPDFINGVAQVETALGPDALLSFLHEAEARFGRTRRERWEARTLDLDLIDYNQFVTIGAEPGGDAAKTAAFPLILPHPRLHLRAFVLKPLKDIAPDWRHPRTGRRLDDLLATLPDDQICEVLDG